MDNGQHVLIPESHYNCIQSNAHQFGILTRASRILIQSRTLEKAEQVVLSTLSDLNLSGCFRLELEAESRTHKYGRELARSSLSQICEACIQPGKVARVEGCIIINTNSIRLIAIPEDDRDEMCDLIQDNLVIFCDTFEAWIDIFNAERSIHKTAYHERLKYADKMNDVLVCISRFNLHLIEGNRKIYQELLSGMIAKFPCLALEADQENAILDLVVQAEQLQEKHLESQLHHNDDLKNIILQSINDLLDKIENSSPCLAESGNEISSIELF